MNKTHMAKFLDICLAISSERDRESLLSAILDTAMELNRCDAGTLYLLEDDGLHFCRMVTKSQNVRQGGHDAPISLPPVPLQDNYIAAYAVMHGCSVRIDDVRSDNRFDFSGAKRYDDMTGYYTGTMLAVPLRNDKGEIIGALQLINALDEDGEIAPFDPDMQDISEAAASLAAISLTNMQYTEQIKQLLNSLVSALSTAIDERTPYNANHTRNMVRYAERFLDRLSEENHPLAFDEGKRAAFIMSVWLHDVGKLVVPLDVMDKNSRLGPALDKIRERFRVIGLLARLDAARGRCSKEESEAKIAELAADMSFIESVNNKGFMPDDDLVKVDALAAKSFTDEEGSERPFLLPEELVCLRIRKGTLSEEERRIMESHVLITGRILEKVYFPKSYARVAEWASAHHELLNGKGYPRGIKAEDIPFEVRLLTVLDVFDALTARDRPYKPPMPAEKAFAILHDMAKDGGIDEDILKLFEESKAWEEKDA